jgi:hypothetical protein
MTDIFDDIFDEAGALGDVNTQTRQDTQRLGPETPHSGERD